MSTKALPGLAGLVLLAGGADAQQSLPRFPSPFASTPLADGRQVPAGTLGLELSFDPPAYEELARLHASAAAFSLGGFPLPDGRRVDLELRPVSALEPGARARVVAADGRVSPLTPQVRCFAGRVVGGGPAFLGITPDELQGYLVEGEDTWFLSAPPRPAAGRALLSRGAGASGNAGFRGPGSDFCGWSGEAGPEFREAGGVQPLLVGPELRTASVFIEADQDYRSTFPSDQACVDYTVLLLTAGSEVYRRDVGAQLVIPDGYLRVWNTTPPWLAITSLSHLSRVYTWWTSTDNPDRLLPRAAVHVLTSPVIGGTARGSGGLCDNTRAYEISSLNGRFPYPFQHTARENWDLFVLCHEFGHTFGSKHTSEYKPPIECLDGSGPDKGTLMSYCHIDYGVGGIGMRFHLRVQQRIRSATGGLACLQPVPLQRGDYDGDGDLDLADLVAADAVLNQGFRSLGAEETLDMDADGDFDAQDRALLAAEVQSSPPAQVRLLNGSGSNPICFASTSAPLLATTWTSKIKASGAGTPTYLLVCTEPLPAQLTPYGELLIRTPAQGGTALLSQFSASDGTISLHDIPLPGDLDLVGVTVYAQAKVLAGNDPPHLCNGLELTLSTHE